MPKNEGDRERVVQLPDDGNEVGHEIEGEREVAGREQSLVPARHPGVADETRAEHRAVRDEPREGQQAPAAAHGPVPPGP
jgi:hypothetical protein